MALGSIVIDLLMKTGSFETDSKKAEKRLKEMKRTAEAAGAALGTALVAGATAATVAIKSSINAMDDMSKSALRANMPTEDFSQLAYAGSLADVALQDLTGSMGKLAKAQGDAQRGLVTQVESFKQLGVEFANTDGSLRSTKDVFLDFADVFQKHQGSPEVMAAGMNVFGRSFQKLVPLLKDGRAGLEAAADEADRLGVTLSTETGQQAEAFNDNLTRLQTAALGLSQAVASDLLPDLVALTDEFVGSATEGDKLRGVASDIADAFRGIGSVVGVAVDAFKVVSGTVRGVMFDIIALTNAANAGWDAITGDWKGAARNMSEAQIARQMAAEASGDIANVFRADQPAGMFSGVRSRVTRQPVATSRLPPVSSGSKKSAKPQLSEAEKEAERLLAAYESMTESLHEQIALHGQTGEAAKVRYEIEHGALAALDPLRKQALVEQAEWKDWLEEMAEIESVWGDAAEEQTQRVIDSWAAAKDEMSVYAEQAGRNMQDAFADFLFDPFKDGLSGMLENFANILKRMAAEAAAAKIFESLGAAGNANTGTWWGDMLSGLFGAQAKGKATGGYISGPGTGTSDSIPAYLSNGEYVINASAVSKYGASFFDGLNAKRFAAGGYVGNAAPAIGNGSGVKVEVVNNGQPVQAQASQERMPDGSQLIRLVLNAVGDSFASGTGAPYAAAKGRFGLKDAV